MYIVSQGVLLGISIRTRKPISLNLAPMFWKMLLHSTIEHEDLEAIDLNYSRREEDILDIIDYKKRTQLSM